MSECISSKHIHTYALEIQGSYSNNVYFMVGFILSQVLFKK